MTEIACEGLVHVYRGSGVRALDGVDLHIGAGERVALVGQNGSGKTTLVRHLNGLLRPTAGRVLIDGQDAAGRTVAQLARTVGLAFQDPDRQIFAGSVRTEVAFGPRNLGMRGGALQAVVDAALAAVGLAGEADVNPYDLGASRRKLLALASVLAMHTPVLVLDEPTTGQDARGVQRVQAALDAASAAGCSVIGISHDMRFVAESFSRVVVMRNGRIILDGAPADVFAPGALSELRSTHLEPPPAALRAERLGLGGVATDEALIAALAARSGRAGDDEPGV